MKISILGLGYVGCVSAGCLAQKNNKIIGVDIDSHKVDLINKGTPTIIEKDIDIIIKEARDSGNLVGTTDINYAILNTDVSIICVGTPNMDSGDLNLEYIYRVAEQIGRALKDKDTFHVVTIRSTVKPGTSETIASIIEKNSGKNKNKDFGIVSNPEFLREGTSVKDYYNPSYTLIGSDSGKALDIMEEVYKDIDAPIYKTDIKVAEIIKYINNSYHALKITFANEVGNICKELDIDSHKVMDVFCKDNKLNISPYYFKPGFAYGGSCLPKDLKALNKLAKDLHLELPVIRNIYISNEFQKDRALKQIINFKKKNIGILGLSFKAGTDDLRESPIVDVVERLIGKGYNIKIFDKNVELSKLIGSNKSYIESKLPHLSNLLASMDDVINFADVIVVTNKEPEYADLLNNSNDNDHQVKDKIIYDLVRITKDIYSEENYNGICW